MGQKVNAIGIPIVNYNDRVAGGKFASVVVADDHAVIDPDIFGEGLHHVPPFFIHSHADYREAFVFVLPFEFLEPRDLDLARAAPGRPEIQ